MVTFFITMYCEDVYDGPVFSQNLTCKKMSKEDADYIVDTYYDGFLEFIEETKGTRQYYYKDPRESQAGLIDEQVQYLSYEEESKEIVNTVMSLTAGPHKESRFLEWFLKNEKALLDRTYKPEIMEFKHSIYPPDPVNV